MATQYLFGNMNEETVKNMYWELDVRQWDKGEKQLFRENRVNEYQDVLLRAYKPAYPMDLNKLHSLVFRPTSDPIRWMELIRFQYANLTAQWTHRQRKLPTRDVIDLSGDPNDLNIFCLRFGGLREMINGPPGEIGDLGAGMQALALEN